MLIKNKHVVELFNKMGAWKKKSQRILRYFMGFGFGLIIFSLSMQCHEGIEMNLLFYFG